MYCNVLLPIHRHIPRTASCSGRSQRVHTNLARGLGKQLQVAGIAHQVARGQCCSQRLGISNCLQSSSNADFSTHFTADPLSRETHLHSSLALALVPSVLGDVSERLLGDASLLGDVSEGLEAPVQLVYLFTLLGFLTVGAYLVVRQVLIRRELEEAAKVLGERVRLGEATPEDYFELGVILLRKKLFTQATRNLEKAKADWDADPEELAQVHNALGYAYFNMDRNDMSIEEYKQAVQLQPGYVTAWNNLGNAYEKDKMYQPAYEAYRQALAYAPDNSTAKQRSEALKTRMERIGVN